MPHFTSVNIALLLCITIGGQRSKATPKPDKTEGLATVVAGVVSMATLRAQLLRKARANQCRLGDMAIPRPGHGTAVWPVRIHGNIV